MVLFGRRSAHRISLIVWPRDKAEIIEFMALFSVRESEISK